ncbi:DUF1156 domain-containing protein [Mycobacterium sp. 852014-52144_SCH5372336]|uniref:DUF1156 domain-containing protein n=1 Tax=Mycobacterium sp. 852014-52144_SCH5372336 TaxID=1834115 RepID=UPI0007FBFE80|nr:DUF1156 domain-containing protein [Mycobacterium sp. 852014-52144_SCH5372336]OBB72530.1 hypothetical protein A5759_18050 [Mycobacterium sp. 852014-52144_SCH5372336]
MTSDNHPPKRKLIEVALPLEAINRAAADEKAVPRRGHPATLHLWWARRPLAAARAVLFAQLVDDPSARPDEFPTEETQRIERERLHGIIKRLVNWSNTGDTKLFAEAHREILKSACGNPPSVLDPFAGGGTIPLEAQRLGLKVIASDLNPVPVLINKALIEIPPKFHNQPPVAPGLADSEIQDWSGTSGLAADVAEYGTWMRNEASARIGHLYPKIEGRTVVGWIWTRTVTCPNPACQIELPLVRSWWLGKKKGKETYVLPVIINDPSHPSGMRVKFEIGMGLDGAPTSASDGTVTRTGAVCVACQSPVNLKYVRAEGAAGRMGQRMMAVVAEGVRSRLYLAPDDLQIDAAQAAEPTNVPDAQIPDQALGFRVQAYGMTKWSDLFTRRQLVALTTFSDLVGEARSRVIADGGSDEYADAVATYLGFLMSKLADWLSAFCSWMAPVEKVRDTFARQAIPMVWDFMEINPFSHSVGNASAHFEWIVAAIKALPSTSNDATIRQGDAKDLITQNAVISTDPPYYDNIGYSDLSDYFYVWLRRTLRDVHPDVFGTLLVPKSQELVANPFRHNGKDGAKRFFEDGFRDVFASARVSANPDYPMTVYYAFRQSEINAEGASSSGWETLLEGMIRSGWEITSTWPMRSERGGRMISVGTNALASSIVLSLRPRSENAATIDRRGFIGALEAELPGALRRLQQGQIAPVDLPQAAIGPGMAVFSRYSAVLEPDGKKMTVRSALSRINEILDRVLNEQEGDFDSTSRFAIAWYRQHGYGLGKFGDADNLARARNTSVDTLDRDEILTSRAGNVQLTKPASLNWDYDVIADQHTSTWEGLHHLIKILERDGIAPAGGFLRQALSRADGAVDADLVKELAHLLFRIAESNGWVKDALSFNSLVTIWPEILDVARNESRPVDAQGSLDFEED